MKNSLHDAVASNDRDEIIRLLHEEALDSDVLEENEYKGKTVLWLAAWHQQWDVVHKILEKHPEANCNAAPHDGECKGKTVLWLAVHYKQWDVVHKILEKHPEANCNAAPHDSECKGRTVLWLAAWHQQWDIVHKIFEKHPEVDCNAVLWFAANYEQWELVQKILEKYPEANCNAFAQEGSALGETVLWLIAYHHQWDILLWIIRNKKLADIKLEAFITNSTKISESILEMALKTEITYEKEVIINYIFIRYITKTSKSFSYFEIKNLFYALIENPDIEEKALKIRRDFFDDDLIYYYDKCYNTISDYPLNLAQESDFNLLPWEVRLNIAEVILTSSHFVFHALPTELTTQLVNSITLLHRREVEENLWQEELHKLAKLAFREWRHHHFSLFLFKTPARASVEDIYECLTECLREVLCADECARLAQMNHNDNYLSQSPFFLPPLLKQTILKEVSCLDMPDKTSYLNAITVAVEHVKGELNKQNSPESSDTPLLKSQAENGSHLPKRSRKINCIFKRKSAGKEEQGAIFLSRRQRGVEGSEEQNSKRKSENLSQSLQENDEEKIPEIPPSKKPRNRK